MFAIQVRVTVSLDPTQFATIQQLLTGQLSTEDQAALNDVTQASASLLQQVQQINTAPPVKE